MVSECRNRTAEPSGTLAPSASHGWRSSDPRPGRRNWLCAKVPAWRYEGSATASKNRFGAFAESLGPAPLDVTRAAHRPESVRRRAVFFRSLESSRGTLFAKKFHSEVSHGNYPRNDDELWMRWDRRNRLVIFGFAFGGTLIHNLGDFWTRSTGSFFAIPESP